MPSQLTKDICKEWTVSHRILEYNQFQLFSVSYILLSPSFGCNCCCKTFLFGCGLVLLGAC